MGEILSTSYIALPGVLHKAPTYYKSYFPDHVLTKILDKNPVQTSKGSSNTTSTFACAVETEVKHLPDKQPS